MTGEVFTQIMVGVIMILGAIITAFVVPWIRAQMSTEELIQLETYVAFAVRCANQIFTSDQWKMKKTYVMEYVRRITDEKLHISLTEDQIETIIEAVVNEVKHEDK